MASAGGALGVHVGTFDDLYTDIMFRSGKILTRLSEPVQRRVLRNVVEDLPLEYYRSIQDLPGFMQILMDVIRELKAGGITPEDFQSAVKSIKSGRRLAEIGEIYQAYQRRLQQEGWMDYIGAGWLTLQALQGEVEIPPGWSPLIVDGFDDFTPVQIQILGELGKRIPELIITLSGENDRASRPVVHKRFQRTREELESVLNIKNITILDPRKGNSLASPIRHLERSLFREGEGRIEGGSSVSMIAAPDREGEVRNALRWLKKKIIQNGWEPYQTAILFRDFEPYRSFLYQTADEFGLPMHVEEGRSLAENPAIAALVNLLQIANKEDEHLPWRETIESWRSPYFEWQDAYPTDDADAPIGIEEMDAERLSWVARWGRVIRGLDQWEEAFGILGKQTLRGETKDEEYPEPPQRFPQGQEAELLRKKFARFAARIQPPKGKHAYRDFVAWVEGIIGDEEEGDGIKTDLNLVRCVAESSNGLAERDLEALRQFKEILRGMVWAERTVGTSPVSYGTFLDEFLRAVEGATYQPSQWERERGILAADVVAARGVPFKAVAILGLGEGEFPTTLREDPFLRDVDRGDLRDRCNLPLSASTLSWEGEYFYEALTRASQALLFTRSRIADNGAPWQPSPYWEEVRRRVVVEPQELTTSSKPGLKDSASWGELSQSICSCPKDGAVWIAFRSRQTEMADSILQAENILMERDPENRSKAGLYDGSLDRQGAVFRERFSPDHIWSASRLESYQTCPYFFFTSHVLGLEPREPPQEGLDARQLGNIYHHIFERLYQSVGENPSLKNLRGQMPEVADWVLDQAPRREGFRETAWWQQTRQEIKANVARSIEVLESLDLSFGFFRAEKTFGIQDSEGPPLEVEGPKGDRFRLRGYIDRVDRDQEGGLRIIDYKTSGPYGFHNKAVQEGKKVQLSLYALAAEKALQLGKVRDGFYFHVQHAEPSNFQLKRFYHQGKRGPRAAMEVSVNESWKAIFGARKGNYVPRVPDDRCPEYCPAANFCWHYTPRNW